MTVAFDVRVPIPKRTRYRERGSTRWTLGRQCFVSPPEYAGKAIYPWWRPKAWQPRIAGRAYGWRDFITVWHVEPNNQDTSPPCGTKHWRWHVRHWKVAVEPWRSFRRRFERCAECNRRMNKASRHGFMSSDRVWHSECMSLNHLRGVLADDDVLIDRLFAAYRVLSDTDQETALRDALGDWSGRNDLWRAVQRLNARLTDDSQVSQ